MGKKHHVWGYDMDNDEDKAIVMDLPFGQLNKKGRRAKKKYMNANSGDGLW